MSERIHREIVRLSAALLRLLDESFPQPDGPIAPSRAFLESIAPPGSNAEAVDWGGGPEPLDRLAAGLRLSRAEIDLLILAGMPDEHEGFASVFRALHPRAEGRPSVGLAVQLLTPPPHQREPFLDLLETSPAVRSGALRLSGDAPLFERSLQPAPALWAALEGVDAWPATLSPRRDAPATDGLEEWLASPACRRAAAAIERNLAATILISADAEDVAFDRALALVSSTGRVPAGLPVSVPVDAEQFVLIRLHTLARGSVPVLRLAPPEQSPVHDAPSFEGYPAAAVLCERTGTAVVRGLRPLLSVPVDRLSPAARRRMWTQAIPALAAEAPLLAARYPIEPSLAGEVAADLACLRTVEPGPITVEDVAEGIRARASLSLSGGVRLIRPRAAWNHLVLSTSRERQLHEAIARLGQQATVLDDWGFLRDRAGARGVRMLFAGPPGTGKTLSAEVVANALSVDLLLVDISRVVSKWIGETEKNLSAVFDAAERAQAVLFFDEADALFGKRTEVSDAHDRYANLETAYLLARLERFEGLAILATNLRQNIDAAFLRRLEFVIHFEEPDRADRVRLWECHIPSTDLLDRDVNLFELAALYPVVGGLIRNAAVAAAFQAAADGTKISQLHFMRAMRREYEKAGKAFPGVPAGVGAV